jgi:hypothetical protein
MLSQLRGWRFLLCDCGKACTCTVPTNEISLPSMEQKMLVTVPMGVQPGQEMQVQGPNGMMTVVVPMGVPMGSQFEVGFPTTVRPSRPPAHLRLCLDQP